MVKRVLTVHGMCSESFEDWFKYTEVYSRPGCTTDAGDGTLVVDTAKCPLLDLAQPSTNQTKWWSPGNLRPELMFMRPTGCNRDYERLEGFTQCSPAPGQVTVLKNDQTLEIRVMEYEAMSDSSS